MSALAPGDIFADHRIEGILGQGGMGIVYRTRQVTLDRPAALKLIAPALSDDEAFRARFLREARAAAAIEHPNVLPVYHAGEAEGRLFVSTPLIEGGDLKDLIRRRGRLGAPEAVGLIEQVAAALDAAHGAGLIHRDVKAANVLIDEGGRAYLTDFGVARLRGSATELTGTGQMIGTLDYVAPEQIEGKDVSERSDVYSLGCLLFEILTGHAVFADREDVAAKLAAHISAQPPSAHAEVSDVPPALDAVIARAMSKAPAERFASAGELAAAARVAVPAAPATRVMTSDPRTAPTAVAAAPVSPGRRTVLGLPLPAALGIGGGAIAAVVIVVLVLALSGSSGDGPGGTSQAIATVTESTGNDTGPGVDTIVTPADPGPTTEAPPPPPVFGPTSWQSPTGNLRCEVQPVPRLFCTSSEDLAGAELDEFGPARPGPVGTLAAGGGVVPYGETWRNSVFVCASAESGITCRSTSSSMGFFLAKGQFEPR